MNNRRIKKIIEIILEKGFIITHILMAVTSIYSFTEVIVPGGDWRDSDGNLIAATEGGFIQVGDTYYLWGMDRSADNYTFEAVNCYSSTDMKNWKFENKILKKSTHPDLDAGVVVERAKILHNEKTGQFVMWMHYEGHDAYSLAHVAYATSSTITKEFTFHMHFRPFKEDIDSRDLNVYKDNDGKAYLICSTNINSRVRLFLLDNTYTKIEKEVFCGYARDGMECEGHGIIFKDGHYFWLMSKCTGWEFNDNHYFHATSLSGPWTKAGNIAVTNTHTYESQIGFAFTLRGSVQTSFLFKGDRWSTRNFGKSRLVVLPIEINGTSLRVHWYDEWNLDVETGKWHGCARKFIKGTYTITSKLSGLVLGGKSGNNNIVQQKPDGSDNQLWRFENRGASHFRITNVLSGKMFDVSDESKKPGAKLLQWKWKDSYNQKWHVIDCGNGYHRFISVNTLGKTLEIEGASESPDAKIVIGNFNYKDHQLFRISSVNEDFVSGGSYQIVNRNSGKSLDAGSDGTSGTIILSVPRSDAQQSWKITDRYDGFFYIRNVKTNKVLSNKNLLAVDFLNTEPYTGRYAQQWQIVSVGNGFYKLVNRMCGKIVTLSKGKNTIIQSNDSNDPDGQWKFQKVAAVNNRICFNPEVQRVNSVKGDVIIYSLDGRIVNIMSGNSLKTDLKQLSHGLYVTKNPDTGKLSKYVTKINVAQ